MSLSEERNVRKHICLAADQEVSETYMCTEARDTSVMI